jgi:glycoprotein-N-acetylgalactosamine 3-beta-galactosyltransferase
MLKVRTKIFLKLFILILVWPFIFILLASNFLELKTSLSQRLLLDLVQDDVNSPHPTIFCIILSEKTSLKSKAKTVFTAWGHKCSDYRFISLLPGRNLTTDRIDTTYNNLFKVLKPEGLFNDTYGNLSYKVLHAFEDVYRMRPDFGWYLKADDDTFIFYDNLRDFAATKNASEPVTFGYEYGEWVYGGYNSGGAGYLLSNEAMRRLVSSWRKVSWEMMGEEDIEVARILRSVGVFPQSSLDEKGRERFHCLEILDHYKGYFPDWLLSNAKNPVKNVGRWPRHG